MNKTYAWRAYGVYSNVQGSLPDGVSFRTPLPPPPPVSAEGGPVPCGGSTGPAIIGCVGAAYPQKLAKVSLQARKDNMEFIRDRIIETGICKGNDFGRNFKRGYSCAQPRLTRLASAWPARSRRRSRVWLR
jgi:hypothetical protein